jgi:gliding motility-associated-like protein
LVPNIITPNGDSLNDVFKIIDDSKGSWRLEVYNRWGKLVFFDKDYNNSWNGNDISDGIYYFFLKSNTSSKTYKGQLTIAR